MHINCREDQLSAEHNKKYWSDRIISVNDGLVQCAIHPVKNNLCTNLGQTSPASRPNELTELEPEGQDFTASN
jgi:hypothetical protein